MRSTVRVKTPRARGSVPGANARRRHRRKNKFSSSSIPFPVRHVITGPSSRLRIGEVRRACCPDRRLCKKKFPSLPRGRFGDVTESNRWLEHLFAEITRLPGRCDRLCDVLGGTGQGASMPAIDVVRPTTVWSCALTCPDGGDVPTAADCGVRSRPREPASCIDRRIACPGSAP